MDKRYGSAGYICPRGESRTRLMRAARRAARYAPPRARARRRQRAPTLFALPRHGAARASICRLRARQRLPRARHARARAISVAPRHCPLYRRAAAAA